LQVESEDVNSEHHNRIREERRKCDQRDVMKQDLEEQYESLWQQLKVAQVELIQQGEKSSEEADSRLYVL